MENVRTHRLSDKYHGAMERWAETFLPDYPLLIENWDRFFPRDPEFKLCAYRQCGMCDKIEVGDFEGRPKFERAGEMNENQAAHLLKAIRAQASTELGSIQQHQLTLSRAPEEQDQFWILRMMAEELRHGYQMFSLLLEDDWEAVSDQNGEEMVEEVLNMRTGSHILGAFNVDFDSFVDNIVFCALIDRVGKYQLSMQKVSAYKPMAESMPPMLQEEAFHLAAGVVPIRRWVQRIAKGEGYVSMAILQKTINKWFPRALDMFGDERGGGTNVRLGFKPMKNDEAANQYANEVRTLVRDLNLRYLRARFPDLSRDEAVERVRRITQEGESIDGVKPEDLLKTPSQKFFRRRGIHAYAMYDIDGHYVADFDQYAAHLRANLPEEAQVGRDLTHYFDLLEQVLGDELTPAEAVGRLPNLSRVGGVCPCSRAVRWILEEGTNGDGP